MGAFLTLKDTLPGNSSEDLDRFNTLCTLIPHLFVPRGLLTSPVVLYTAMPFVCSLHYAPLYITYAFSTWFYIPCWSLLSSSTSSPSGTISWPQLSMPDHAFHLYWLTTTIHLCLYPFLILTPDLYFPFPVLTCHSALLSLLLFHWPSRLVWFITFSSSTIAILTDSLIVFYRVLFLFQSGS